MKRILSIIVIFIIVSNVTFIKTFWEGVASSSYFFTTHDQSFKDIEVKSKGRTFESVVDRFNKYKKDSGQQDLVLYRLFKMQPYKFWLWSDYIFNSKYKCPYLQIIN